MGKLTVIAVVAASAAFAVPTANGHLVTQSKKGDSLRAVYDSQTANIKHSRYVCNNGKFRLDNTKWHCLAFRWLKRERNEVWRKLNPAPTVFGWAAIQIKYATIIAQAALREGSPDPWPNCPDPYFNGASWQATVNCENGGNWLDSPGYYRCGLQFDPGWESHFGVRFCP